METGEIARQANGSVMVSIDGTSVLTAVTARREAKPGYTRRFFQT
jgi:polyribonucleotide nucleotidyltransferase